MKLKNLYSILGVIGFFAGFVGLVYFIGQWSIIGPGGCLLGCGACVFASLSSFALISLAKIMEQNEKQEDELKTIKEYLKSKDDAEEFAKKIEEIESKYKKAQNE